MRSWLIFTMLSVAACAATQSAIVPPNLPGPDREQNGGKAAQRDWTILVYMAADEDDLKPYAYMNIYEMESALAANEPSAGPKRKTDVLVQLDTPGQRGLRRIHIEPAKAPYNPALSKQYFENLSESDLQSQVLEVLDEPAHATSLDAAQDLKNFLHWGIARYPARHYMAIVWGHGSGWAPAQKRDGDSSFRSGIQGIATDKTQGTYLDTGLLSATLQEVIREDLGGRPFDIYASDACLMQSIEVATELTSIARFIVGSAQIQPFTGLPYRKFLGELNSGRFSLSSGMANSDPDEAYLLARRLPSLAAATLGGGELQARLSPDAKKTFTLSAVRSSELRESLVPALHEVGRLLVDATSPIPMRAVELGQHIQHLPSFMGGATDIGFFLQRLKDLMFTDGRCRLVPMNSEEIAQCSDRQTTLLLISIVKAQEALFRTVVSAAYGDEYAPAASPSRMLGFSGFSVWLPRSTYEYQNRITDFADSAFYKSGPWGSFLARIFSNGKN